MSRRRQRGIISLAQLQIVLGISMLVTTAGLWQQARTLKQNQAVAQADALVQLTNAVTTYTTNQFTPLVNGTAVTGVANAYSPTVAELQAQGVLSSSFAATNYYNPALNPGYQIQITTQPAACVAPNCDLAILVNLRSPIVDPQNGRVDGGLLGAALQRAGGNAGYSDSTSPGTIRGWSGTWSAANPVTVAGQPVAGILAMRAGYGSSGLSQFLRRDGTLPMTGNLNMGSQDITSADAINSTTLVNSGNASVGGTLGVTGQTTTNGITNTGALQNNGNVTITGSATTNGITNTGNITNSGDVKTGRLWLQTTVVNGATCPGLNGYQAATAAGSIASCVNGVWTTPNAATAPLSPCGTATLGWGGGCSGSFAGTVSGSTSSATATVGTGSATATCSNGVWGAPAGTCTPPPSPCNGSTASWGGGKCYASYGTISSGSGLTVNASLSGPAQAGGSYSGSAYLSCNNGTITQSSQTCTYSNATPEVINASNAAMQTQPTGIHISAAASTVQAFCSAVLPGYTSYNYSSTNIYNSGEWTCWNNSGYSCAIPGDGSTCAGMNGCSCWWYAQSNGGNCFVATGMSCTRTGP